MFLGGGDPQSGQPTPSGLASAHPLVLGRQPFGFGDSPPAVLDRACRMQSKKTVKKENFVPSALQSQHDKAAAKLLYS